MWQTDSITKIFGNNELINQLSYERELRGAQMWVCQIVINRSVQMQIYVSNIVAL